MPGFSINYNENFGDRMVILYDSLTGNVARFVKKLPLETRKITEGLVMEEAFVLITFTTGLGKVPDTTASFLEVNHKHLKGVASSGNKNFGVYYAVAADEICETYHVPIVSKFELSGTQADVNLFMERLIEIETH